ncbi:blue copper protein 1a-like [Vitis vinifera]|uniref:blue copper protein 1a-like n=1 Tax=Vitis vinifera TaxID=29760 RepID=UPI0008FED039|nr:blue copper protein 1a-like [Vitis vinifera]|eukprot:XP_019073495.1 PREDICTED: uncharacterized protein LOC104877296 [Vitis vinifera]
MASKRFVGAIAILAFVLAVVAMTTEFALLKVLRSILIHAVFNYTAGRYNVIKVNAMSFTNSTIPPANEALSTGNDKLAITVLEESASPAPASSTPTTPAPSSAHGISGSGYHLLMAAMVVVAFLAVWPVFTPEEP